LGDKPASAELSFEPAISIAGKEGDNYRAKFRFHEHERTDRRDENGIYKIHEPLHPLHPCHSFSPRLMKSSSFRLIERNAMIGGCDNEEIVVGKKSASKHVHE